MRISKILLLFSVLMPFSVGTLSLAEKANKRVASLRLLNTLHWIKRSSIDCIYKNGPIVYTAVTNPVATFYSLAG